jgi:membrane-associated protease RseP (regulator of RpoE activity)
VPAGLLVLSVGTAFISGANFLRTGDPSESLWRAQTFAICVLLAVGAHACGHFVVARRHGVDAWCPYFVPQLGMSGTAGAYVKLQWPIADRRALIRIFAAGPIAGFIVSTVMVFVGMALSSTMRQPTTEWIVLGDSLVTLAAQRLVFPGLPESETVVAHPVMLAGWVGLNFGTWHVLPAGRFDAGRIVYALFGYKTALVISWVTIGGLVVLSSIWSGWFGVAVLAVLTLIRLKRQHPVDRHDRELDGTTIALAWTMIVILVLTFVPVPATILENGVSP